MCIPQLYVSATASPAPLRSPPFASLRSAGFAVPLRSCAHPRPRLCRDLGSAPLYAPSLAPFRSIARPIPLRALLSTPLPPRFLPCCCCPLSLLPHSYRYLNINTLMYLSALRLGCFYNSGKSVFDYHNNPYTDSRRKVNHQRAKTPVYLWYHPQLYKWQGHSVSGLKPLQVRNTQCIRNPLIYRF